MLIDSNIIGHVITSIVSKYVYNYCMYKVGSDSKILHYEKIIHITISVT